VKSSGPVHALAQVSLVGNVRHARTQSEPTVKTKPNGIEEGRLPGAVVSTDKHDRAML
jgi:hypothetical protein